MNDTPPVKLKPSERPHYVNNKEFSSAVVDYVKSVKAAGKAKVEEPQMPEYIGNCLLKITEGLSRKPNFIRYTYRQEMVADAIVNCVKVLKNFDIKVKTRSGLPNAFAYFTQISYYAFLRRIAKEKRVQDTKILYMEHAGIESFANFDEDHGSPQVGEGIVERIRNKADQIRDREEKVKTTKKAKKTARISSSLSCFLN